MIDDLLDFKSTGTRRDFLKAGVVAAATSFIPGCGKRNPEGNTSKYPIEISPGLEQIADMDITRYYANVLSHKNLLHVFGGSRYWDGTPPLLQYSTFDPVTLKWTQRKDMPEALAGMASFVFDEHIMTVGGKMNDRHESSSGYRIPGLKVNYIFRYNQLTGDWDTLKSFPLVISSAEAVVVDGVPFILGGHIGNKEKNLDIFMYNKSRDIWEVKTRIPISVDRITATSEDGKIYLFCSKFNRQKNDFDDMLHIYDYRNDGWDKRDMPSKFGLMFPYIMNDSVHLLIHNDEGEQAIYSHIENGEWKKTSVTGLSSDMLKYTGKVVHNGYLYLVGPSMWYLGSKGYVHRFKLPSTT